DVQKNRAEARRIAEALGYRPDRRIAVKVSTRNIATAVNATVVLIDQLKEIYIDGELERIDNALWFPKVMRHDYVVALAGTFKSVDDPDQIFYETYSCGAKNNRDGYCNPEIDKLIEVQRWLAEFVAQHQFGAQRAPNWSTRRSLGSAIACATA